MINCELQQKKADCGMLRGQSIRGTLLVFLLGCVSVVVGCSTTPDSPTIATPVISAPQYVSMPVARQDTYHVVAPMETLWRISKIYGVDQRAIVEANGLRDPRAISVGQKLIIPQAEKPRAVIPLYNTRPWSYIVIHHSATDEGNAFSIDKSHHNRGFWNGMGYHFLIDNGTMGKETGQIEAGPRWIKQMDGAHCNAAGMNENGIGICLVGNFSETGVPGPQLDALVFLTNVLRMYYRIPPDRIMGHGDVPGKSTECPGKNFPWTEFRRRLADSR